MHSSATPWFVIVVKEHTTSYLRRARTSREEFDRLWFAVTSNNQRALGIKRRLHPVVLHSLVPVTAQHIDSEAVVFEIHDPQQASPESDEL